mmetsp:Transcript_38737/g.116368  ORF Transcript_38737/g.116368 Transcript_38737/m.116368 type:complete len:581 (-) Transcript_38737:330-2072(-)|eukprot:CAMPEP_0113540384 /NCGR_PEP_ID=MMETSP0015_2-20120614/8450_1 /TAXON_ID=2838 /ORGANISM="Odontella" /LENGTH=580 /DNA_ID=CAMNT_0000440181 /DNA_START=142 /DNA_END=1884 /DNA_ORIENTATION=- /assembly_acc=CAM_ASM_000160
MGLTTAERNRRKRERKKREREEQRKREEADRKAKESAAKVKTEEAEEDEVEIEYVPEPLALPGGVPSSAAPPGIPMAGMAASALPAGGGEEKEEDDGDDIAAVIRRFQSRSAVVISEDEASPTAASEEKSARESDSDSDEDDSKPLMSKRKMREMSRPTVAELKNRVGRPDLVEAHDVTAADPDFLICLKGVPGTVQVPRHWGRKRKYLQGKRGIEKPPFQLPDFIMKTGICDIRSAIAEDEAKMSAKQKNRSRVAPRAGGIDVDYRTLHDAFFKHQTRPVGMTSFGDLYYEGKEFETRRSGDIKVGQMSERLRDALGMANETTPSPWLVNMQRYGPPPSYPNLRIPGLNAPIPPGCSYGYHIGGWGKPPVDAFGRPLYGGNPFDAPAPEGGSNPDDDLLGVGGAGSLVTSDGKALGKKRWGALPTAEDEEESSEEEEEESSGEEMESESEEEEAEEEEEEGAVHEAVPGTESVLPPEGADSVVPGSALDLRKSAGEETPAEPKQLYTVLRQTEADREAQAGAVFKSDVAYVLPGSAATGAGDAVGGAESVLSKVPVEGGKRKRATEDEDEDDLGKKFKF